MIRDKTETILRWGIVGLGTIAHKFMHDITLLPSHKVVAAASRSDKKAMDFIRTYEISRAYGNYQDIMTDPDVDIIYVATPHHSHAILSIAALEAGKHVLCEKPLAVNRSQAEAMVLASMLHGTFLMEALWSRFNPSIQRVLHIVQSGAIGKVNYLNADFSFLIEDNVDGRLLNMDMAGGSLLDIGVYPLFLAYSIFGKPLQILSTARFHKTGADIQTTAMLKYGEGMALIMSGFASRSDMIARVYGTEGSIHIHTPWHESQGYTIRRNGKFESVNLPTHGKGFTYEIEECRHCIGQGETESELWSHQHSLDLLEITDEIRRQIGLRYPFE